MIVELSDYTLAYASSVKSSGPHLVCRKDFPWRRIAYDFDHHRPTLVHICRCAGFGHHREESRLCGLQAAGEVWMQVFNFLSPEGSKPIPVYIGQCTECGTIYWEPV